jgi:hypothetical protein
LAAVGSSTTEVSLKWTASSGAASYDVERSSGVSDPYVSIGTPTTSSFTDTGRSPFTSYLYRVRARNSTGVSDWAVDPGTTLVFTDPVLTAGLTIVNKNHFTELRQAVDSMRTAAELGTFTWTDDPLVVETTLIKAVHIEELRSALQEAREALGLLPINFTDGTLTPQVSVVKAIHIQNLRDGL